MDSQPTRSEIMRAPSLALLLGEARVLGDFSRGWRWGAALPVAHRGDGRPVLVIPGFLSSDSATVMLRRTLEAAGYAPYGWGMGRNLGIRADIRERLDARLEAIGRDSDRPVTLIGWSLGGLIAREYAKHVPERIDRVITLGSPFSGDIRANHAWRLYELIAGHAIDRCPVPINLTEKPPVPTYAIWSGNDGIVAAPCARGTCDEADRALEVRCGHLGFLTAPDAIEAVFEALAA